MRGVGVVESAGPRGLSLHSQERCLIRWVQRRASLAFAMGSQYTEPCVGFIFTFHDMFCGECVPGGDTLLAAGRGDAWLWRGTPDGVYV